MSHRGATRAFALGLALKVLALPLFASHYSHGLFIPFLDLGAHDLAANPWRSLPAHYFPYGGALYLALVLPRAVVLALFGPTALAHGGLSVALLKLPLLALDAWLLHLLVAIAPRRRRQLVWLYWLNPVLFFITYVHGQLDVAATALCVASLAQLVRARHARAAALMALAVLCKAHVLIVLPLVAAYIWKREFARSALRQLAVWGGVMAALCLIGFWPHLRAGALSYVTAASPQALQVFAAQLAMGEGHVLYLGVALLLAVLGRLCTAASISEAGLLFGSGALFAALVLVTHAMPGWYYWSMPFLALLYASYVTPPRALLAAFCVLYLAHFGLAQAAPGALPPLLSATLFTLMQTAFAGLWVAMWHATVRVEAPLVGAVRPLLVGIAGDSASGKDTLTAAMAELFDPRRTAIVAGDNYHKWERGDARWQDYTHLHPRANHLQALAEHTADLTDGRMVFHPHYDHGTGTFTAPREVRGSRLVIVQGLHALYLRDMRAQLDLKIFLAPHPLVRLAWKIDRDVRLRGHTLARVLQSIDAREADALAHIAPQRALADWIIEVLPVGAVTRAEVLAGTVPEIEVRHTVWNDVPVAELARALNAAAAGCRAEVTLARGDISRVTLRVRGEPSAAAVAAVAAATFPRLRALTRSASAPAWAGGHPGVNQLVALALLDKGGRRAHLRAA